ncbi:PREDICTED: uncharacterized protein LOC106297436 [Brassica oleracea var. oleracea]|uniref:uncharacterized protein LOC106297436 n=1 Tax=Brassica oleracea var. oleracea TaxID=109376 RepID=UPI0006A6BAED|nr:PREDICTED: uncharacterized protein LOC106297436 [Brassica oleracea var. oleracea]
MSDYCFKDPTPAAREFLVDKFNQEFNISVTYRFFKEKLDQLKRKYKKYKHLMKNYTGISVDPTTSVISASDSWWKDRESQYSLHQRREELMNNGQNNDEGHYYSETYGGEMQHTQIPETQENEEISNPRVQQRGGLRRGSSYKLKFLQALTGYTRDSELVGKRLESGQKFGSPTCGQWSSGSQQWGTPPNPPQWGTPPSAPQWGTLPNAPQWSSPSNVPQWGTPPNAPQWGTPPNAPQWS